MRSTARAAPGRSDRNATGSSTRRSTTDPAARTVAVAGRSRTADISPKTAPGVSIRANGTPSCSMTTCPETST